MADSYDSFGTLWDVIEDNDTMKACFDSGKMFLFNVLWLFSVATSECFVMPRDKNIGNGHCPASPTVARHFFRWWLKLNFPMMPVTCTFPTNCRSNPCESLSSQHVLHLTWITLAFPENVAANQIVINVRRRQDFWTKLNSTQYIHRIYRISRLFGQSGTSRKSMKN